MTRRPFAGLSALSGSVTSRAAPLEVLRTSCVAALPAGVGAHRRMACGHSRPPRARPHLAGARHEAGKEITGRVTMAAAGAF